MVITKFTFVCYKYKPKNKRIDKLRKLKNFVEKNRILIKQLLFNNKITFYNFALYVVSLNYNKFYYYSDKTHLGQQIISFYLILTL